MIPKKLALNLNVALSSSSSLFITVYLWILRRDCRGKKNPLIFVQCWNKESGFFSYFVDDV